MTVKTEQKKTEQKKGNFLTKLVLIIILFCVGSLVLMQQKPELFNAIINLFNFQKITEQANETHATADNSLVKEALQESYSVGAEPPLLLPSPKENSLNIEDEVELAESLPSFAPEINPYDEFIDNGCLKQSSAIILMKDNILNDVKKYREYLANANMMLLNFNSNKNYDQELEILKQHQPPDHLKNIITLIEDYNQNLAPDVAVPEEVLLFDSKLLAKFIKVQKITEPDKKQEKLKLEIQSKLKPLVDYLYSLDLQNSFLGKYDSIVGEK